MRRGLRYEAGLFVQQALILQRLFTVAERVERFVLDLNDFGGVVGDGGRGGDHRDYGFALITRFGNGQRIVFDFGKGVGADFDERLGQGHDFRAGESADDAGDGLGRGDIDAENVCVGVGRTDETQVEHVAELDIVGEFAAPAKQAVLFLAGERVAYPTSWFAKSQTLDLC